MRQAHTERGREGSIGTKRPTSTGVRATEERIFGVWKGRQLGRTEEEAMRHRCIAFVYGVAEGHVNHTETKAPKDSHRAISLERNHEQGAQNA